MKQHFVWRGGRGLVEWEKPKPKPKTMTAEEMYDHALRQGCQSAAAQQNLAGYGLGGFGRQY